MGLVMIKIPIGISKFLRMLILILFLMSIVNGSDISIAKDRRIDDGKRHIDSKRRIDKTHKKRNLVSSMERSIDSVLSTKRQGSSFLAGKPLSAKKNCSGGRRGHRISEKNKRAAVGISTQMNVEDPTAMPIPAEDAKILEAGGDLLAATEGNPEEGERPDGRAGIDNRALRGVEYGNGSGEMHGIDLSNRSHETNFRGSNQNSNPDNVTSHSVKITQTARVKAKAKQEPGWFASIVGKVYSWTVTAVKAIASGASSVVSRIKGIFISEKAKKNEEGKTGKTETNAKTNNTSTNTTNNTILNVQQNEGDKSTPESVKTEKPATAAGNATPATDGNAKPIPDTTEKKSDDGDTQNDNIVENTAKEVGKCVNGLNGMCDENGKKTKTAAEVDENGDREGAAKDNADSEAPTDDADSDSPTDDSDDGEGDRAQTKDSKEEKPEKKRSWITALFGTSEESNDSKQKTEGNKRKKDRATAKGSGKKNVQKSLEQNKKGKTNESDESEEDTEYESEEEEEEGEPISITSDKEMIQEEKMTRKERWIVIYSLIGVGGVIVLALLIWGLVICYDPKRRTRCYKRCHKAGCCQCCSNDSEDPQLAAEEGRFRDKLGRDLNEDEKSWIARRHNLLMRARHNHFLNLLIKINEDRSWLYKPIGRRGNLNNARNENQQASGEQEPFLATTGETDDGQPAAETTNADEGTVRPSRTSRASRTSTAFGRGSAGAVNSSNLGQRNSGLAADRASRNTVGESALSAGNDQVTASNSLAADRASRETRMMLSFEDHLADESPGDSDFRNDAEGQNARTSRSSQHQKSENATSLAEGVPASAAEVGEYDEQENWTGSWSGWEWSEEHGDYKFTGKKDGDSDVHFIEEARTSSVQARNSFAFRASSRSARASVTDAARASSMSARASVTDAARASVTDALRGSQSGVSLTDAARASSTSARASVTDAARASSMSARASVADAARASFTDAARASFAASAANAIPGLMNSYSASNALVASLNASRVMSERMSGHMPEFNSNRVSDAYYRPTARAYTSLTERNSVPETFAGAQICTSKGSRTSLEGLKIYADHPHFEDHEARVSHVRKISAEVARMSASKSSLMDAPMQLTFNQRYGSKSSRNSKSARNAY